MKRYLYITMVSLACGQLVGPLSSVSRADETRENHDWLGEGLESPVQAASRPFGLEIVAPVQLAGSDERAHRFQQRTLHPVTTLVNAQLGEYRGFMQAGKFALDPSNLRMAVESTARVYFIGEGAGYRNTLGFNTLAPGQVAGAAAISENAKLIFPDASSAVTDLNPSTVVARTSAAPLLPGDFVDLGTFEAGTTLDFFLIANGASGGSDVWTASASRNRDGIDHVVAFALPSSPYLIIGFEDMFGGGDLDYNDVVFAVDIGAVNVDRLLSAPEPGAWALMITLGGVAWVIRRRVRAGDVMTVPTR